MQPVLYFFFWSCSLPPTYPQRCLRLSPHRRASVFQRDHSDSFVENCKGAEVEHSVFGKLSTTRSFRKHLFRYVFGIGNLPILVKSSAKNRSYTPLCESSALKVYLLYILIRQPVPHLIYLSCSLTLLETLPPPSLSPLHRRRRTGLFLFYQSSRHAAGGVAVPRHRYPSRRGEESRN